MKREIRGRVSVSEVAPAMGTHDVNIEHFLDRSSGEVVMVLEVDDSEEGEELRDAIEREPDRFEPVPRSEARDDHARMDRFVDELDDPEPADALRDALAGKGAFSRFRAALTRFSSARDRWFAFEERDRERLAREWLASIGAAVKESARPSPSPEAPRAPAVTPLRIAHVLLLGAPEGKTEILGGGVRRRVPARTEGEARRVFKELARDLYESNGIAWRNRFIEGRSEVTLDDVTLTLERDGVTVVVAVPPEIVARFRVSRG